MLDTAELLIDRQDVDILEEVKNTAGRSTNSSIMRWMLLIQELRGSSQPKIDLPILKADLDWKTVKVAKGKFDLTTSCLPDPFLLAAKGAVSFSSHCGRTLMPACAVEDQDVDSDDDA